MRRRLRALWPVTLVACLAAAVSIVRSQATEDCTDAGNRFSFFLWSDSYTSAGEAGVVRLMQDAVDRIKYPGRLIPRFWVATGDIPFMSVSNQYLEDLNNVISNSPDGQNYPFTCSASNGKFPYFVAIGNHDVDGYDTTTPQAQYDYWKNFVGPKLDTTLVGLSNFHVGPSNGYDARTTYSFDYKNAHFVVVNQYYADPTYPTANPIACIRPELQTWIDQDLTQTTQPVKFVAGHEPAWSYCSNLAGFGGDYCPGTNIDNQTPASRVRPYSSTGEWLQPFGEHWGDSLEDGQCPEGSREAFWSMLASHNVVAHFAGHTHTYSGRLVQGDGTRRNDVSAYSKTGQTFSAGEGVWEVNTGQAHNSAGTAYVLVTVQDNLVTFEAYDQITYAQEEPFKRIESWSVAVDGNYNRPPVVSPVPRQTVGAGNTLTFTASASDPEGQALTFSLVNAPPGAAIDPVSGTFTWSPTSAQAGTFDFSVKVTDAGAPPASATTPVEVVVTPPPPDLLERVVSTTTTVLTPGATLYVSDTVANQGSTSIGFVVAFHLSLDTSYGGPDDVALTGTRSLSTLRANASSSATTRVTVPAAAPLGSYHVCAAADPNNAVAEISETNNTLCTTSTIVVTRPDLAFQGIQPGATSVRAGATLSVTDTVQNVSALASGSFKVGYRLSANQTYGDGDDISISATRAVTSLAAGAVSQGTAKLKIPTVAPGSYYICAADDSAGTVAELDEGNNAGCSAAVVKITK